MKSMIYDVGPFLLLFFIVMAAFAIGLQSLYRGYPDMIRVDPNSMLSTSQPIAFIRYIKATHCRDHIGEGEGGVRVGGGRECVS